MGWVIAVYWICMIYRLLFVASVVLLSFPFVGVYLAWKVWVAFGLGVLFFIYSLYSAVRHISEKGKEESEDSSEDVRKQE